MKWLEKLVKIYEINDNSLEAVNEFVNANFEFILAEDGFELGCAYMEFKQKYNL